MSALKEKLVAAMNGHLLVLADLINKGDMEALKDEARGYNVTDWDEFKRLVKEEHSHRVASYLANKYA